MKKIIHIYHSIINAGIDVDDRLQKQYKMRTLNKFCLFTILIAFIYGIIFYKIGLTGPVYVVVGDYLGFGAVIYLNYKRFYTAGKFILISTTAMSVLSISIMMGFDSGFHLYLYTSPLFIFWLFDIKEIRNIILSFMIYVIVYIFVFFCKYYYEPLYNYHFVFHGVNLDTYSLNMVFTLLLLFILFYSYSTYYKILAESLIQKQKHLENEIQRRIKSEENTENLFSDLSQSYNNLKQFSFLVSHNLRSPLSNIKGFLMLYDKSGANVANNEKIIGYLETATNNLDDVLTDLNYILKSRNQLLERKEDLFLKEIIHDIAGSLSVEIESTETQIVEDYDDSVSICTIKTILHSVMLNLIQNAIKYKKEFVAPLIRISAEQQVKELIIKVSDNGIGIDLEKYGTKIFNLYSRFNNQIQGKGIGLYLVKNHLEMIGGSITVESRLDEGTVFIIKINN